MKAEDQRTRAQSVPDRIGPDDPRHAALVGRGFNKRFAGKPDYVRLVHCADDARHRAKRGGDSRAVRSQPRSLVGAHRRGRRQLRDRDPLLVPIAGRHRE
jgi:hypothetical protein